MPTYQGSFHCPQCRQPRLFISRSSVNHVVHALISLFLCGLWIPIWILIALGDKPQYFCSQCGYTDATRYLANPNLRQNERILAERRQATRDKAKEDFVTWLQKTRFYRWLSDSQNTWKVAVGTVAGVLLGVILIFVFIDRGNQTSPTQKAANTTSASPMPVDNNPLVNRLKKDMAANYSKTSWYPNIKNISVNDGVIGVFTNLPKNSQAAKSICGGVSFTYYGYDRANQDKAVIVYGFANDVLAQRKNIGEQCK